MRPNPIETAKKALKEHYPEAAGAFVGGSVISGHASSTSDIDIVVLFPNSFDDIHRFSTTTDGWPIEFIVHNVDAQDFYFDKDRLRGMCVMPTMVGTGIMIPEATPELRTQQEKALKIIEGGPPELSESEIEMRRYIITDLLDDLVGASESGERNSILVRLHDAVGDFYLRGQVQWSGVGKALIRKMAEFNRGFTGQFVRTFESAFCKGSNDAVVSLVESVLEIHGGRHRDGFRSPAPETWRTFKK